MSAIGIDLGTVNSCVAVWRGNKVEVIANAEGNRITPSTVAFTDTERYIGEPAVNQKAKNLENTVYDVKRLIGRRSKDPLVQKDKKRFPFTVVDVAGKPKIQVKYRREVKQFAPEEISAMVLEKMKKTAEDFIGSEVKDAVISVPAYFNDAQRQATIDAGKIAGLNVMRIINEPTAAALAYGYDIRQEGTRNILIYDLGGGTFDVSIVTIVNSNKFIVKATTGNTHLGGGDFDELLVNHMAFQFEKKHRINVLDNNKALWKLKTQAEKAKHTLSSNYNTDIEIDALVEGIDFTYKLSRATFDQLCLDLFNSTLEHVNKALKEAKLSINEIHDVVLVGGSTRIPKVQELLKDFFKREQLKSTINADEAVAYGAAIQAAMLNGEANIQIKDITYNDLTSLSLGVQLCEGTMNVIIPRQTPIPCKSTAQFVTSEDNQTYMIIEVYEGEERKAKENNFLGRFILKGIPAAPADVGSADITFDYNANGILTITAVETITGKSDSLTIRMDQRGLSAEEIETMSVGAERFEEDAGNERRRVEVLYQLQSYANAVRKAMCDADDELTEEEKEDAMEMADEELKWLDGNLSAAIEVLQQRLNELLRDCQPYMDKITQ